MNRHALPRGLLLAAVLAVLAVPARAATPGSAPAAPRAASPARRAATSARAPGAPAHGAPGAGRSPGLPRSLDDVHIEGEIPVPQVLFITARDQRRFMDFQTRRYLRTSRQIGDGAVFPTRVTVTGERPAAKPEEKRP